MKKRFSKREKNHGFFHSNFFSKNCRGNILTENIIFIVLNLIFFTILILFVFLITGDAALLEEEYAKQIALIIDASRTGMIIHLNMENAIEKAKKEWGEDKIKNIVSITGNTVTVKLRDKGGYSYSFFNDVDAFAFFDNENKKDYIITIRE